MFILLPNARVAVLYLYVQVTFSKTLDRYLRCPTLTRNASACFSVRPSCPLPLAGALTRASRQYTIGVSYI